MSKLKTHSGAKKRIKVTGSGKLVRRHTSGAHFLQKKRAARKRRIHTPSALSGRSLLNVQKKLN